MSDNESGAFISGCLITLLLSILFIGNFFTFDFKIEDGGTFIIRNASYKCDKTNELKTSNQKQ